MNELNNSILFRTLMTLKKNSLSVRCLTLLTFAVLIMTSNLSNAEKLGKPMAEREVFLKNDRDATMHPSVIVQTDDGGFVVAGSISAMKQGWATKVDADGKVLWSYYRELQHDDQAAFSGRFVHPEFHGIVPMSDGSVYLCGDVPRAPSGAPSPLLTHLDAQGKLIGERFIVPGNKKTLSLFHAFDSCLRWGNDLVLVGHEIYAANLEEKSAFRLDSSYWILLLDSSGNVKWEQNIPSIIKNFSFIYEGMTVVQAGTSLIFSATDNNVTEIISVSAKGKLQEQKKLDGYFQLVRPTSPDGQLQVYGSFVSNTQAPRVNLSLNEKLEEIKRVQGNHPNDFATRSVYRMPDQSLVFFGSSIHPLGKRLRSGMAYVDRLLQENQLTGFDKNGFDDDGTIRAAAASNKLGEFVTAQSVSTSDKRNKILGDGVSGFKRGAVLHFIQFKK